MDAFAAIELVSKRIKELEDTLAGLSQRKFHSMATDRDLRALICTNELMLIALLRTYDGYHVRLKYVQPPEELVPKIKIRINAMPQS